jgi:hypothetical protein
LQWRQYASGVDSKLADLLDRMQSPSVRQRPENIQIILTALNSSEQTIQIENIEERLNVTKREVEAKNTIPLPLNHSSDFALYFRRILGIGLFILGGFLFFMGFNYIERLGSGAQGEVFWGIFLGCLFASLGIYLWGKITISKVIGINFLIGIALFGFISLKSPKFYVCTCNQQPSCAHRSGSGEDSSVETTQFGEKYMNGDSSFIVDKASDFQQEMAQANSEGFVCLPRS